MKNLFSTKETSFATRHYGGVDEVRSMLSQIGAESIQQLIEETIPQDILRKRPLMLPEAKSESQFLDDFSRLASLNKTYKNFIGLGYYGVKTPPVIQRNVLENPGWYTAYTPYQAEISQGRMEALVNYQTIVTDLTGMDLANASLLDEATAAAEAVFMGYAVRPREKKSANTILVDENIFATNLAVVNTRAKQLGLIIKQVDLSSFESIDHSNVFCVLFQYPGSNGLVKNYAELVAWAIENKLFSVAICDLLALTLLQPPGQWGADCVVGSAQRFGVPMGLGGPYAAYFATREKYKRQMPGRIIGVSKDRNGKNAYRMALQTREQHIKRERATSNICTSQVLLAVIASFYAVYHGPSGLKHIASHIHDLARILAFRLDSLGYELVGKSFFDTITLVNVSDEELVKIKEYCELRSINLNFSKNGLSISFDELSGLEDVNALSQLFAEVKGLAYGRGLPTAGDWDFAAEVERSTLFMDHPVFNTYNTEHELLRYIKRLESKDMSLVHGMIPLGSCTMKLNASAEMMPLTWKEWSKVHPFAPIKQLEGYTRLIDRLGKWRCEITGFSGISFQPNSGAQGEYAGLLTIKAYHQERGEGHRNITLIPASAHGTNPASASVAGMKVVIVKCDELGNIDIDDLKVKCEQHSQQVAALMITYPSTHGVFEENVREVCQIVHQHGGQVYMDGANMNAQVGLTSPRMIGADVCHLNLHKTFCIPHGGGGPGMGPICVRGHLIEYLPEHVIQTAEGGTNSFGSVSSAPWGSASILTISYAYIELMGGEGLKHATELAILKANYIKSRLEEHYPILYAGNNGRCAHEFILDCRGFKPIGIEVEDIAKRLIDYSYHAPTVSFPVAGTLMIEPTESESLAELDRFCEAMIAIKKEIDEVASGEYDAADNVLKNAPHDLPTVTSDAWNYAYSREKAAYPLDSLRTNKFWSSVSRVDNAYGDRNLFCSCIPIESMEEAY